MRRTGEAGGEEDDTRGKDVDDGQVREEQAHDYDVQRDAEEVIHGAAHALRHQLTLQHSHGREVDADAELEDAEAGEAQPEHPATADGSDQGHGAGAHAEDDQQPERRLHCFGRQGGDGGAAHADHGEECHDEPTRWRHYFAPQCRCPVQDEGIHAALKARHRQAQCAEAWVAPQQLHSLLGILSEALPLVEWVCAVLLAIVLLPEQGDQHGPKDEAGDGKVKGT
mmetsp:Transcript_56873/g.166530  ORF Transcript_56873/g.166530 Transcript_56873/m.166530 type:complete len:225 (-) Transcript_56873:774-1448(-)